MYAGIPTVSVCINTDYCRSREERIRSYMAKTETINDARDFARKKECIDKLRPIDDKMFEVLAKEPGVCEEILRVILEDPELKVLHVTPQDSIRNLYGRSVRLDALCELSDGKVVNVEVQRSNNDNHLMRTRYNTSCVTANITDPGEKFENVPTVFFVYISEFDVFGGNKTTYHIDSVIRETGTVVDDKCYRIFVNTKVKDETEISKLMEHFIQKDFADPDFPKLSEAIFYYKHTAGGVKKMCAILDEYTEDRLREKEIKNAKELFANGLPVSMVKKISDILTEEELNELFEKTTKDQKK